jgi:hypothetical protein
MGLATTLCSPRRNSASLTQLLEQVLQIYPAWGGTDHQQSEQASLSGGANGVAGLAGGGAAVYPHVCLLAKYDRTLVKAAV